MRQALRDRFPANSATHPMQAIQYLISPQKENEEQKKAQRSALENIVKIAITPAYAPAFNRWKEGMDALGAVQFSAETTGPLAIGLGNPSPYEVGLTLHRTYGVPYLPGSALKGLARRAALACGLSEKDEAFKILFGNPDLGEEAAGYVTFWDGWMVSGSEHFLQQDTITVHHPKYYSKGGKEGEKEIWPTDFDDPNPVAFLSVPIGKTFHLALSGPREWAEYAARLLDYGLTYLGLGGKTNAGYGGFEVDREKSLAELEDAKRKQEAAAERARLEAEVEAERQRKEEERLQEVARAKAQEGKAREYQARIDRMNMGNTKNETLNIINQTADLSILLRRPLLQNLLARLESDNRSKGDKALLRRVREALEGLQ